MNTTTYTMMKLKRSYVLVLMLLLCPLARAERNGPITSGGGNAVVCFDDQGKVKSARLLDFYEGEVQFGDRFIDPKGASFKNVLAFGIKRLGMTAYGISTSSTNYSPSGIATHIAIVRKFVPMSQMPKINDSMETVPLPSGCQVRQAAAYMSEGEVLFAEEIWDAFTDLDRAGLIVHEVVYWFERRLALSKDSRRARRVTAAMFNPEFKMESVYDQAADSQDIKYCMSGDETSGDPLFKFANITSFYVYQSKGRTVYHFHWIGGEPTLTKTVAFAPDASDVGGVYDFELQPAPNETVKLHLVEPLWTGSDIEPGHVSGTRENYFSRDIPQSNFKCMPLSQTPGNENQQNATQQNTVQKKTDGIAAWHLLP